MVSTRSAVGAAESAALRDSIRRQAAEKIAPLIPRIDRDQSFATDLWAALRDMGVFSLALPEAVGGQGAGFTTYIDVVEELSRVGAIAGLFSGTTVQIATILLAHANVQTVARWVPALVSGDSLAAWAFTEPTTGSDPRQLTTQARRDGADWVLDGTKVFISYASQAAVALVFAKTAPEQVTAFAVDTASRGWTTGTPVRVMAFGGGEPAPVFLDGVRVPDEARVGEVGDGFRVMLEGEGAGKVRAAAICVGIAQRALDEAVRYAGQRLHRGEPIVRKFATIRGHLADMQASVLGARALVRDVAQRVEDDQPHGLEAAAARLVAGRAAREVTSTALDVCGAYGLTEDLPVERLYREGKFYEVAQGSADLQRVVIARHLLSSQGVR